MAVSVWKLAESIMAPVTSATGMENSDRREEARVAGSLRTGRRAGHALDSQSLS